MVTVFSSERSSLLYTITCKVGNRDGHGHLSDLSDLRSRSTLDHRNPDHLALRLPAEAGHDEELAVQRPHDARALLGHDLRALHDGLGARPRVVDPDAAVLAHRGEEAAALTELGAVQLQR